MFEANHQCISTYEMLDLAGSKKQYVFTSKMARDRCDPYDAVMRYHQLCSSNKTSISLKFDHSINGGPFYRIVDELDICQLHYVPFTRNTWIKTEYDNPEIIGYPVKDFFDGRIKMETTLPTMSGSTIRLPGLEHTDTISMDTLQKILFPFVGKISL
jgi:hypothetical protein